MHETIVRVLKLSSIIVNEKLSSENYLNGNKIISYLQIFFNNSRRLVEQLVEQLCVFTVNVPFKSLISFIMWIKFCEVAFYFRRDYYYFIYFNLMHLVSFQMGRIKINM